MNTERILMSQAEYARHRGVSRQAIGNLISAGKIPESAMVSENGTRLIDTVAADFALGERRIRAGDVDEGGADDPTFGSRAGTSGAQSSDVGRLTQARTATEIYRARMAELEYDQMVGKILLTADAINAMERCAAAIVRDMDNLPNLSDEILDAINRDGAPGCRMALKAAARKLRVTLAETMRILISDDAGGRVIAPPTIPS